MGEERGSGMFLGFLGCGGLRVFFPILQLKL